jgi:glyoxylase-like metal-dependent hydrolase (beta-lactamase superfamily II)
MGEDGAPVSEYNGNVRVGGPVQTHELAWLMITKVAVGPMDNNAYLLRCRLTDEQVLIDAANDAPTLLNLIGAGGLARVITTHRHGDHWQALAEIAAKTNAITVAGRFDVEGIPVSTTEPVSDGDQIRVGEAQLEVIHLVGHTPGSIALLYDDPTGAPHLFTGDSLFPGGVGNTHGDPAAFERLLGDVQTKLFDRLPDETWVYPGHGADTTLGNERPSLPEWRARGW